MCFTIMLIHVFTCTIFYRIFLVLAYNILWYSTIFFIQDLTHEMDQNHKGQIIYFDYLKKKLLTDGI